jgi:hypothetical protein
MFCIISTSAVVGNDATCNRTFYLLYWQKYPGIKFIGRMTMVFPNKGFDSLTVNKMKNSIIDDVLEG